ncbi:unnamed protein product [Caenorhabditis nigoni]|uniref:Origin recognition complex subunit 3 n=1 Tax=Caenorhabditis nigoni TaxID=1611254 RepID=A0A2G5UMT4_9PELO|nr:hypothetical protein B9Z55_008490 [Caenorhabditis nigoni]
MTPGIKFHRGGQKALKLERKTIETLEFPEDFEFHSDREQGRFVKNFQDDVTRFDEKVSKITEGIYDTATSEIATWILDSSRNQKTLSVFSPDDTIGNLRTALVQCNFTDISRLIRDFRQKTLDFEDERREIRETIVTENDAIHEIIDKVSEMPSTPDTTRIIIIRQFESLRPHFLDSLVSLLYSNATCRSVIPRLRLMICVSTSPAFFTQNSEIVTMNMLELKQFKFTQLEDVFIKIISTGIHAFFEPPRQKPKKIEDDDPKLLMSYDCAPALFSGSFMKYLKNRFLACDYSVSALIRAIQFAMLQKYIEVPLWREETHSEELQKYDDVLRLFLDEFGEHSKSEFVRIHMEIQWNPDFWKSLEEEPIFRERKQFLVNSRTNLMEFGQRMLQKTENWDSKFSKKLEDLLEALNEAYNNTTSGPTDTQKTPNNSKMTFLELKKQREQAMIAKQQNPISTAKSAIFTHIMSFFQATLRPYPATWRNVVGTWQDKMTSLDSSDDVDIEKALLSKHLDEPVSVAWRALLCHRNFKMVPMNEWAEAYLENIKLPKKEAKGAFFAAAGQLEHIGLIRGAADKKSTNINVQYHPIHFVPSL